ncbi:MAG: hypothetical protein GTO18_10250 [Anaerolineales bacterium]|nr:hypothetical protein [Anaerolineales bacterium]
MSSRFYVEYKPSSRTDQLRQHLTELDAEVGKLGYGMGSEVLGLLEMFDEVDSAMRELLYEGYDLDKEKGQFETIIAVFQSKADVFLREIGGRKVLSEVRSDRSPESDQRWWFVDTITKERRKQFLLRFLRITAIAVGIILVLGIVYKLFLEPDPSVQAKLRYQDEAYSQVAEGNFEDALGFVEMALEVAPEDPELVTLKGVVYEGLEDVEAAAISFLLAEELFQSREIFLQTRADIYIKIGLVEKAFADIETLFIIQPDSVINNLLLAVALEADGKLREAIDAYDRVSDLAEESGDDEMVAFARIRKGQLLMQLSGSSE